MARFFKEAFSRNEISAIKEILAVIRPIFSAAVDSKTQLFLIGMKALYYYYGIEAFSPAPLSIDININFDIIVNWATYRKVIPQQIKVGLEELGYHVDVDLTKMNIQREGLMIDLTTVIE